MKHQTVEQVRTVAEVHSEAVQLMSSLERLQHWADLLDREPNRQLATLRETEFVSTRLRDSMRRANSPISVAFADPVFRAQGMRNDTYGEAKRFFGVSDHRMHAMICYCHFGDTVSARTAAQAIRWVIAAESRPGLFTRLRRGLSRLRLGA